MRIGGRTLPRRLVAILGAALVVSTGVAGYVVAGEHSEALNARVYPDPSLSLGSLSRSEAPSGSVLRLEGSGVIEPALLEFRVGSYRALSPVLLGSGGAEVVVPLRRDGAKLIGADGQVRLIARRGPLWVASGHAPFRIVAPPPVSTARPGLMSLFGLEIARAMIDQNEAWAAAAAAGGAPAKPEYVRSLSDHAASLKTLSTDLEAAVVSSGDRVTLAGVSSGRADLVLADQLVAAQLRGWGPASESPCGAAKDLEVDAVASGSVTTVEAVKIAAQRYARALIQCDVEGLRAIARRAGSFAKDLAVFALHMLREVPKVAGLVIVTVASAGDSSVSATELWRRTFTGANLAAYVIERKARIEAGAGDTVYVVYDVEVGGGAKRTVRERLTDMEVRAAEESAFVGTLVKQARNKRDLEQAVLDEMLTSDFPKNGPAREKAAKAEPAQRAIAQPVPNAPAPQPAAPPPAAAAPAAPSPTLVPVTLPTSGGPLALAGGTLVPATVGTSYSFSLCQPAPRGPTDLCPRSISERTTNPTGGAPPYRFQLESGSTLPPGISLNLNGTFSGTPSAAGQYRFSVCVVDVGGNPVCQLATIDVGAAQAAAPPATQAPAPVVPAATPAPTPFNVDFQVRIKMASGGDSRIFFTVPAGVNDALTRVSASASTHQFSKTTTRGETIFQPCSSTGTITVHRQNANQWTVGLSASITSGGYGCGVTLEVVPLGVPQRLSVSCSLSSNPGSTRAIGTVIWNGQGCNSSNPAYSGAINANTDTFITLQVSDPSSSGRPSGSPLNANGSVTATFSLRPAN